MECGKEAKFDALLCDHLCGSGYVVAGRELLLWAMRKTLRRSLESATACEVALWEKMTPFGILVTWVQDAARLES